MRARCRRQLAAGGDEARMRLGSGRVALLLTHIACLVHKHSSKHACKSHKPSLGGGQRVGPLAAAGSHVDATHRSCWQPEHGAGRHAPACASAGGQRLWPQAGRAKAARQRALRCIETIAILTEGCLVCRTPPPPVPPPPLHLLPQPLHRPRLPSLAGCCLHGGHNPPCLTPSCRMTALRCRGSATRAPRRSSSRASGSCGRGPHPCPRSGRACSRRSRASTCCRRSRRAAAAWWIRLSLTNGSRRSRCMAIATSCVQRWHQRAPVPCTTKDSTTAAANQRTPHTAGGD